MEPSFESAPLQTPRGEPCEAVWDVTLVPGVEFTPD